MRIWGSVLVGGMVVVGSALVTVPGAGATPSHPGGVGDTCPEVLAGAPTGGLEKSTTPPAGQTVGRGAVIEVTLRWDRAEFSGTHLHKALDCVTIDGQAADDLSVQQRDTANDGEFTTRITVPAGLADGVRFCDRGFVSGPTASGGFAREKSNDVCFTVEGDSSGAATPVPVTTPEQVQAPSATPPVAATPSPLPATTPVTVTVAPTVSPIAAPPAVPATAPDTSDVGAGPAGHGPAATEVAGTAIEAGEQVPTLPRTGTDVRSSIVLALAALVCGQLAFFAARSDRFSPDWRRCSSADR